MAENVASLFEAARHEGRPALDEKDGKSCLSAFGMAVPQSVVVTSADDGRKACDDLTPPFAVKGMSRDVLHKSDVGAVRLNLTNGDEVVAAITEIEKLLGAYTKNIDGYLIEEMAAPGHELVIGGLQDPQFGPLVMVGLGGIFIEVFEDVAFGICPITKRDANQMLDELKSASVLAGARGGLVADREAIIAALLAVGGDDGLLMSHSADIAELDINPLIVSEKGAVAVDARVVLFNEASRNSEAVTIGSPEEVLATFKPLYEPQTIGVVGASSTNMNRLNNYMRWVRNFGFKGDIYPIHPTATEIDGMPAYPSLADTPKPVDYAMVGVPSEKVPATLEAANGRCRFAHIIAAGFGEKGTSEGDQLQEALIAAAKKAGVRLLGPNCNGGFSPRSPYTYVNGMLPEIGTIGCVSQSGGLGIDLLRRGETRGLRFSGLMTIGNAADLGPTDLLEFYLADPKTKIIGMYVEGVKEGRKFFELLRRSNGDKPVVLLKGGRTALGLQAAASHTGSLAGDDRVWQALARQTGALIVSTLEEYLDVLLAFQMIPVRAKDPTTSAAIFGNGGGTSVLAVDGFANRGIRVDRFLPVTQEKLADLGLPPGCALNNPIDTPGGSIRVDDGAMGERIMEIVYANEDVQAFVMHLNIPVLMRQVIPGQDLLVNLMDGADRVEKKYPGRTHFLLVLRSDGRAEMDDKKREVREWALQRGYPVFDELTNAVNALWAIGTYEAFRAGRE